MEKRTLKIGTYDTAPHGWTLTGCTLSAPDQKTNYTDKPGGDGSWDLSTALTGGVPRYRDRTLTATLENSQGTREEREEIINEMVNQLDGLEWEIVLPDRPDHYLTGRVHVAVDYSNLAHAAVTITATCSPWLFYKRAARVELTATAEEQTAVLRNSGRRAVVPVITVAEEVVLVYDAATTKLSAGTYEWPALLLTPGLHMIEYSGSGPLTIAYREAVLR